MFRTFLILFFTTLCLPNASGIILFGETFDTFALKDTTLSVANSQGVRAEQGHLLLSYISSQKSRPVGIEIVMPPSPMDTPEREIDMKFLGGGTEMSNSLFISYAVGSGKGLSLPPLPGGSVPNDRTGYILRLIRHGDGTNEVKMYRNDDGWTTELKNEWLPANPITALRRVRIKHKPTGVHLITVTFDTGAVFEKTFSFEDAVYPPDNHRRWIQLIVKGHAGVGAGALLHMRTDSWAVTDRPAESPAAPAGKKAKTEVESPEQGIRREWEMRKKTYGPGHPKVAESIVRLAELYVSRDPSEAEGLYKQALKIQEKAFPQGSLYLSGTLSGLAGLYRIQLRYDEAEPLYKRALAVREKVQGPDHLEVAILLQYLADIYDNQGRYDEYESACKRALQIREKISGPDDPEVVSLVHWLAELYRSKGRHAEAEPMLKRALSATERVQGPEHISVANILSKLQMLYVDQGRYKEAEPIIRRAVSIKEKALGPDHPEVANMVNNLAILYHHQARFAEAEELYKKAMAVREKALGSNHFDVGGSLNNLGLIFMLQGKYAESERAFRRAMSIWESGVGPDHPSTRKVYENMSLLYKKTGRSLESDYYASRASAPRPKQQKPLPEP